MDFTGLGSAIVTLSFPPHLVGAEVGLHWQLAGTAITAKMKIAPSIRLSDLISLPPPVEEGPTPRAPVLFRNVAFHHAASPAAAYAEFLPNLRFPQNGIIVSNRIERQLGDAMCEKD